MDIGNNRTLIALETADLDILADGQDLFLQQCIDGHVGACRLASQKCFHICRILGDNRIRTGLYKVLEIRILRNKVGFRVYFDGNANILRLIGACKRNALCGNTASLLCSSGKALFSQEIDSGVHIAVCFSQCLLAVHHSAAGLLTKCCNVFCCKSSH